MVQSLQIAALLLLGAVFGLSALSRRYPHVGWLQAFRFERPRLSEEQQAKIRRRANIQAGIELILLALVLPFGYFVVTLMTWSDVSTTGVTLVLLGSVVLTGLGVTAIWRNRQP